MTIPSMNRATGAVLLILAVAALVLPACGREGSDAATQAAAEQSRLLDDARAEIAALEARALELEESLAAIEEEREDAGTRVDRVTERLMSSLAKVREALSETKAAGNSAAGDAASALANAGAALRDLTILENRFEYHLRQHGSGS